MPWKVYSENSKYCVHEQTDSGKGEQLKCYDTKEEADDYVKALYANAGAEAKKALITDWSDLDSRQLSMEEAGYSPLGFTPEQGCANCNWFVSPNSCVSVWGDISPTGVCKLWLDKPVFMFSEKSWFDRLIDRIKAVVSPAQPTPPPVQSAFRFFKDVGTGQYRFFVTMSNCFEDRHGEIISTEAHKEYVAWATKSGEYPDLWLWHSGVKSKWGRADWIDFVDGFVVLSGLVDADKEYLVEKLKGQELGASHGFFGLKTIEDIIVYYRTFEVSALPHWAAANVWTDFNLTEVDMGFTKEKRDWLISSAGVSEETVAGWEADLEGTANKLKELGIAWKESQAPGFAGEIAALASATGQLSAMLKEIKDAQEELSKAQADLAAAQAEQTKTFEERVATVFTAKIAEMPKGYEASKDDATIVDAAKATPDTQWFGEMLGSVAEAAKAYNPPQ